MSNIEIAGVIIFIWMLFMSSKLAKISERLGEIETDLEKLKEPGGGSDEEYDEFE